MPDEVRILRHSIRGTFNALRLGISAMYTDLTPEEAVEFLDYMIQACDKMCEELDQYDLLPDALKVTSPPVTSPV